MTNGVKKLNWATQVTTSSKDSNDKVLGQLKKREASLISRGYRWIAITPTYKALIPCDENGIPTKLGEKKIKKHQEMLGI